METAMFLVPIVFLMSGAAIVVSFSPLGRGPATRLAGKAEQPSSQAIGSRPKGDPQ